MRSDLSRRTILGAMGTAMLPPAVMPGAEVSWPPAEGPNAPKICLGIPAGADEAAMRRVKQIGVDYVLMGGPRIPWEEADIRFRMERLKAAGLTLCNMMIAGF